MPRRGLEVAETRMLRCVLGADECCTGKYICKYLNLDVVPSSERSLPGIDSLAHRYPASTTAVYAAMKHVTATSRPGLV